MQWILKKIVGTKNERDLKRLRPLKDQIHRFEAELQGLSDEALAAKVRDVLREWPFLDTVLDDLEEELAKTDLDIASRYARLAGEDAGRIFDAIREEYHLTTRSVLILRDKHHLLEDDRTLHRGIRLRNPDLDPLHLLQVDLLERWRSGGRADNDLLQVLFETVNGIAEGLGGTG